MFTIQTMIDNRSYYFHKKGKIILFNSFEEAQVFLQRFAQYAFSNMGNVVQNDPMEIFNFQNTLSSINIVPKDFEDEPECGIILFEELFN